MRVRPILLSVLVVISVLVANTAGAGAQARISGAVIDSEGNPISGAVVTITCQEVATFKKVVKVSKRGEFKVLILDATRDYMFHVEADGYQPQERSFKVDVGSTDNFFEFRLKNFDEARAADEAKTLEQPGYKEFEEGRQLLQAGDMEGARVQFAAAVEALPDLVPALSALADLELDAGHHEAALDAARRCLEQEPEMIRCLAVAANASQALGDTEAHAEYMARYEELNPDDPTVLYNAAVEFLNKMDDEGARPLLERCLESDPEFPECLFEYGMLLLRSGDMEGAKQQLEKYLEVAPDGKDADMAQETIKYL